MEDYHTAFLQRATDVTVLDKNGRRIAAIHFGGVAIECLLKHIIITETGYQAMKNEKVERDAVHLAPDT
jgi:hypothetical protein